MKALLVVLLLALYGVPQPAMGVEEFRIWIGGGTRTGILKGKEKDFEAQHNLKIVVPGDQRTSTSVMMFADVVQGRAEAAVSSVPFDEWVEITKKEAGLNAEQVKDITFRVVGSDNLEFMSHPDNGVKSVEMEQLAGLLSGKVKNWKELGGKDLAVKLILTNKSATNVFVAKRVLKGGKLSPSGPEEKGYEFLVEKVLKTPGAFGFAPKGTSQGKVAIITTPVIGRPVTLITKGKPSKKVHDFGEFLRAQAKAVGSE